MKLLTQTTLALAAMAGLTLSANAATVLTVTGASAHDGGNWPNTLGHVSDAVNGNLSNNLGTGDHNPQMDITADPNDPSTWLNVTGTWQSEWLGNTRLDATTSANNKIGWFMVDFGSATSNLENMYLWASQTNTGTDEDMRDYNLYIATAPTVAMPGMPNSKTNIGDYDFASGGWTQVGGTNTLVSPSGDGVTQTVSLGGATAQYVGIEILTAGNGTLLADRVGFGQVEFTAGVIPEPSAVVLFGLGSFGLILRRRRK